MSGPIENINGKTKDDLSMELTSRNLLPANTLEEMRVQARNHNKTIKVAQIVEQVENDTNTDEDSDSSAKVIKYTKIIYNESQAPTATINNWHIKFDGSTCVREFIQQIDEKCRTRNVKHRDIVRCFPDILEGLALLWFRSIYTPDLTWDSLKSLLIRQFEGSDRQIDLKIELFNMKQSTGMSAFEFTLRMKAQNNKLDSKLPENELLQLSMRALLPMYTNLLASRDINTFEELTNATQKLESFSPPNTEKQPSPSTSFATKVYTKDNSDNAKPNRQHYNKYFNNTNNQSPPLYNNKYYNRTTNYQPRPGHSFNNQNHNTNPAKQYQRGFSNNNKEKEINSSPKNPSDNRIICNYCKKLGHRMSDCRKKASDSFTSKVGSLKKNNASRDAEN